MDEQFDQLVEYIRHETRRNVPHEQINRTLTEGGWTANDIHEAFVLAKSPRKKKVPLSKTFKKYTVTHSFRDAFHAIKNNAKTFLLSTIISYIGVIVFLMLATFILSLTVLAGYKSWISTPNLLLVFISTLIVYTIFYTFSYSFTLSATSLALNDGASKQKNSLKVIFSQSLKNVVRIMKSLLLFSAVVFGPIMFGILTLILLVTQSGQTYSNTPFLVSLLPFIMLATLIWSFIASLRYSLVPYVALFEPEVPIIKTLKRSSHLLTKGGQWFIAKFALLLFVIITIFSAATGQNTNQLANSDNIGINISILVLGIIINSMLVMLYRNRKIVRG